MPIHDIVGQSWLTLFIAHACAGVAHRAEAFERSAKVADPVCEIAEGNENAVLPAGSVFSKTETGSRIA